MKELMDKGLRGANLFQVKTTEMVRRYNDCLEHLGLSKTKLRKFSIDKIGWSPEIAAEKGDMYLSHGLSNIVGIILSVEQSQASLHFPHYSFDKLLMSRVYEELQRPLMDITTQTGVCIDFENGISRFTSPFDLLMSEYYQVSFSTPLGIGETARTQKEAVAKFEESTNDWNNPEVREALIESAKIHGDLRRRNLLLHPIHFHDVTSFYTSGFGGTFVFRDFSEGSQETLMVMIEKQKKGFLENPYEDVLVIHIADKHLPQKLLDLGIVSIPYQYYKDNPTVLERLKDDILADFICRKKPKMVEYATLPSNQRKALIHEYGAEIPSAYFELEHLIRSLDSGKKAPQVSSELALLLLYPMPGTPVFKETVLVLLTSLSSVDVVRLYRYNKERFYQEYSKWSDSKKKWAIWRILNHYKMKGSSL